PVIVARQPIPHLAPLLWTAAGLVTLSGSPAAHLFASARSLGVPAVAGVDLDLAALKQRPLAVSVNGEAGVVAVDAW
ncbi:MAG TPA: PEP-utilizing enzyme, partial [Acidimicrobiia bacterium]|nr:PEP-utilizing enzyme [Acidimicrobiia bacterium]